MSLIKGKQLQDLSIELGKINWEGYTVGDTINGISATKSPVNKTYVDSEILSNKITLVSGSGTTVNGSSFDLGGTLSSNILIDGSVSNYDFILGDINKIGKFTVDSNGIIDITSGSGYFRADSTQSSIGISGVTNDIVNLTNISLDLSHHELTAMGIDAITSVQVPNRDLSFWNAINTNIPTTGNSLVGGGEFVTGYNGTGGFYVQTTDEEKNTSFISSRNSLVNKGIINSSIIGGENIIANQSNTVYLPKLRIGQGANAIISAGSTEDLLVLDGSTGEIKSIPQSSVSITLNDGIGTVFNTGNSAYDLGGEITSTGQFDVYFKNNAANADSFRTYIQNNSGDSSQIIQGLDLVDIRSDSSTGTGRIVLDNVGLGSVLLTVNNTFNFDLDPDGLNGIKADIGAITNSRGIFYTGFGEAGNADATGANYSSLVSTSLVPKKYVDDLIAIATPYEGATVQTTNGTLTPLATIPITINTFKGFELHITATQSDLSNTKYMRVEGAIKNAAGTTAIVGSPTVFTIAQDAGAAVWEVVVSANDINDELVIEVTGETATTIDWKIDTRLI